ncbi:SIP domain-containing protein [Nonomuraea fuscirosea]|uniref:SIP domain-containing protein n=1 Tax=Nonomuraea fuscirosea TaxID=1291556 RepID=UPI003899B0A0
MALIDEGIGFNPPPGTRRVVVAAGESGLPALAGILASLPADARGHALAEIPSPQDRQPLDHPEGVERLDRPRRPRRGARHGGADGGADGGAGPAHA